MFIAIHPETGARVPVEPGNVVAQEMKDFDLYGTGVYCLKCSEAMRKNRAVKFPSK